MKKALFVAVVSLAACSVAPAQNTQIASADSAAPATQPALAALPATRPSRDAVGEQVPSEDSRLRDFHSLGLVNGRVDIFRCASPLRETHSADEAKAQFQHLYDLGIRTVISLEDPYRADDAAGVVDPSKLKQTRDRFDLEKAAATGVGITFVNYPMNNSGPHSFESMSDAQVKAWLDEVSADLLKRAAEGGVVFHCSAGHDRTGMVAAYIRMKYEHWPVQQAIDEMRRYGHNWKKFSHNGGQSSWHEDHLRAIAKMLGDQ